MKKLISKKDIRKELEQSMAEFLNNGGEVEEIERGVSGYENSKGPIRPQQIPSNPNGNAERTFVPDVIAAIDARRSPQKADTKKKAQRRPKKKIIYDDFGEPIRIEWE